MPLLETRGAASAKGFGFTAGGKRVVDWSKYVLIPNTPNQTAYNMTFPTRVSFFNIDTGTLDFDVSIGVGWGYSYKVMRVEDWLYLWSNISTGTIYYYNIITGAFGGALSLTPPGVAGCDVAKMGNENNPLLPSKVCSANRTEAGALVVSRWIHDNTTGGFTLENTTTINGVFVSSNQTGSSYSTPQIAPMGTMADGVWTYAGFVGYVGYDDYPGPTYTRWLVLNVPYTGAVSVTASQRNEDNFSRPSAGTIEASGTGQNRAILCTLDNSAAFVVGSNGGFTSSGIRSNNAYGNGYAPAAVVGGNSLNMAVVVQRAETGGSPPYDYTSDVWTVGTGGQSYKYGSYTFGYATYLSTVIQMGFNTTYACFISTSYALSSGSAPLTNINVLNSSGARSVPFPNVLSGRLIDGFSNTSRIVSYGA